MVFDRQEHKDIVLYLLENFSGKIIGTVVELKKAVEGAVISKDKQSGDEKAEFWPFNGCNL